MKERKVDDEKDLSAKQAAQGENPRVQGEDVNEGRPDRAIQEKVERPLAPDTPVTEGPPARAIFRRRDRILTRQEYQAIYSSCPPIFSKMFVFYCRKNSAGGPRLGVSVTRKVARRAVVRNRIKRLLREAFRLNKRNLPEGCDMVANAKKSSLAAAYKDVEGALLSAARRVREEGDGK